MCVRRRCRVLDVVESENVYAYDCDSMISLDDCVHYACVSYRTVKQLLPPSGGRYAGKLLSPCSCDRSMITANDVSLRPRCSVWAVRRLYDYFTNRTTS